MTEEKLDLSDVLRETWILEDGNSLGANETRSSSDFSSLSENSGNLTENAFKDKRVFMTPAYTANAMAASFSPSNEAQNMFSVNCHNNQFNYIHSTLNYPYLNHKRQLDAPSLIGYNHNINNNPSNNRIFHQHQAALYQSSNIPSIFPGPTGNRQFLYHHSTPNGGFFQNSNNSILPQPLISSSSREQVIEKPKETSSINNRTTFKTEYELPNNFLDGYDTQEDEDGDGVTETVDVEDDVERKERCNYSRSGTLPLTRLKREDECTCPSSGDASSRKPSANDCDDEADNHNNSNKNNHDDDDDDDKTVVGDDASWCEGVCEEYRSFAPKGSNNSQSERRNEKSPSRLRHAACGIKLERACENDDLDEPVIGVAEGVGVCDYVNAEGRDGEANNGGCLVKQLKMEKDAITPFSPHKEEEGVEKRRSERGGADGDAESLASATTAREKEAASSTISSSTAGVACVTNTTASITTNPSTTTTETTTTTTTSAAAVATSATALLAQSGPSTSETRVKSRLQELLQQPSRRLASTTASAATASGFTQVAEPSSIQHHQAHFSKPGTLTGSMQFYPPPPQHARTTPPPSQQPVAPFAQPYGMTMRPHEEETRQIMNLDNQQAHNSSPTSSWNGHQTQQYTQMANMGYPRGPPMYAPMPHHQHHQPHPHHHQPASSQPPPNPYYQPPPPQQQAPPQHMQPQAMMPPGMQQQPYYNTQSPLSGAQPSMNYGGVPPAPIPSTNGTGGPIFSFKPRGNGEGTTGRRKKAAPAANNGFGSPKYGDDIDASTFPDMSDFPLLDVVQTKAKKDAGRKPCRPHLCEQSRMLISRVGHFNREFAKRLPSRHPLANSALSKPDQWTSTIMGISLATVRKCLDASTEEEVFTRCTDKNLVNLTPAERQEREEMLTKLSSVFEDEKSLGAGTAGLTIAEYSPRRSYSNSQIRQTSTEEKSNNSVYTPNGGESNETTLLNLDDHSNSSKEVTSPKVAENQNIETPVPEANEEKRESVSPALSVATSKGSESSKSRGRPKKAGEKKRKMSVDVEEKEEIEKKTEDENETMDENEKKVTEEEEAPKVEEREDDAASSEGTNRSETATPEPASTGRPKRRKKRNATNEESGANPRKKRSTANAPPVAASGTVIDEENGDHKMLTRAKSRQ